jgi:hypothetical protein
MRLSRDPRGISFVLFFPDGVREKLALHEDFKIAPIFMFCPVAPYGKQIPV